jgi:LCP family protein required for cell wall assembly
MARRIEGNAPGVDSEGLEAKAAEAQVRKPRVAGHVEVGRTSEVGQTSRRLESEFGQENAEPPARRVPQNRPNYSRVIRSDGRAGAQRGADTKKQFKPKKKVKRIVIGVVVLILIAILAIPTGFLFWANSHLKHIDALSQKPDTTSETYLIAGTDKRDSVLVKDDTEGVRTDSVLLLVKPKKGPAALISIPRDTLVDIPGNGQNKINAAYSFGGPKLLVETVEKLTDIKVDHYVEIGMLGTAKLVDAVGGITVCSDLTNIDDPDSGLKWNGGCHEVDGGQALAFARMRYQDPLGDIGRAERQRQVIKQLLAKVQSPATLLNVGKLTTVADAGFSTFTFDEKMNILDVIKMAFAFKDASSSEGITGNPPISDMGYDAGPAVGSAVLLDSNAAPGFWHDIAGGNLPPQQGINKVE